MVTSGAKREAVAHLCREREVSQRRACSVLGVDRSSVRYRSVRPDDAARRKAMKAVAAERRIEHKTGIITGERAAGPVRTMHARRHANDKQTSLIRAAGRYRSVPVIGMGFLQFFAKMDQAATASAVKQFIR